MKIAIVGCRNYNNYCYIKKILDYYHKRINFTFVLSGGSKGVDTLVERWCKENQIFGYTVYLAQWNKYGKRAGPRRNLLIAESCDAMIAFPSKYSKGTYNAINLAKKLNKNVSIHEI